MGDEINPAARRVFRRKKAFQGGTWTPPSVSAIKEDGAWCHRCRQRHGYKSMDVSYERGTDGKFKILWACRKSGDVIEEM